MPKLKTHQGTEKRFKKTKHGKLLHQTSGQDHFRARQANKLLLKKRRDKSLAHVDHPAIQKLIPY